MIKLELKFPDLGERFKQHQRELLLTLAATMQTNRAMMFDKDGADNGKPAWDPLVLRNGRPLQKTGTLKNSMGPQNDGISPGAGRDSILRISGKEVAIGTKLSYATMMNDGTTKMPGGVLRPKTAKALKIPLEGGGFMFRRSVKIPSRRMDEITEQDEQEFSETLANHISDILSKDVP